MWSSALSHGEEMRRKALSSAKERALVKRYEQDTSLSIKAVGQEFGIAQSTAFRVLKSHGAKIRPTGLNRTTMRSETTHKKSDAISMWEDGSSIRDVAVFLKVTPARAITVIARSMEPDRRLRTLAVKLIRSRSIQYKDIRGAADSLKLKGECQICTRDGPLVIDHDHHTGVVRGLLCSRCNSMLGFAKDSIDILSDSISYLENTKPL